MYDQALCDFGAAFDVPTSFDEEGCSNQNAGIGWLVVIVFPVGPQGTLALPSCRVDLVLVETNKLGDRDTEDA